MSVLQNVQHQPIQSFIHIYYCYLDLEYWCFQIILSFQTIRHKFITPELITCNQSMSLCVFQLNFVCLLFLKTNRIVCLLHLLNFSSFKSSSIHSNYNCMFFNRDDVIIVSSSISNILNCFFNMLELNISELIYIYSFNL